MIIEKFTHAAANPGDHATRYVLDFLGAAAMAAGARESLQGLVNEGRAIPPSDSFPEWGAASPGDVGIVSALSLFSGLPETMAPDGAAVVWGLTITHCASVDAARQFITQGA